MFSIFFYSAVVLYSLGQLGRISFLGQQINLFLYELPMFLILIWEIIRYGKKPLVDNSPLFKSLTFLLLFLFISFPLQIGHFSFLENIVSILYLLRLFLYLAFFIYLRFHLKKGEKRNTWQNALRFILISTVLISFAQYFFYPNLRNLIYLGWDPHQFRMFGVFFDTSVAGAIYGFLFFIILLSGKELAGRFKWFILALLTIAIILTFSRSLYLVFIFTLGSYLVYHRKIKIFLACLLIFSALVILTPKPMGEGVNLARTFSISSRVIDYQNGLKIFKKYPLFGIGYNRIRYVKKDMGLLSDVDFDVTHSGASFHSSFLVMLVTGGMVGLAFFLVLLVKLSREVPNGGIYLGFLGLLSFFDNILLHPFILFLLFLMFSGNPVSRPSGKSR